jgi:hypothetical protein
MDEILSWSDLGTTAAVAGVTAAATQIIKGYLQKIDPKWIALGVATSLTFTRQFISGDLSPGALMLAAMNSILAAGTAIGTYEGIVKPVKQRVDRGGV